MIFHILGHALCYSIHTEAPNRLLKKAHLLRCPYPSSLRRTSMYASFLGISGALYLDLFEQPVKIEFFRILIILC
jgi:hypothetical protein